MRFAIVVPHSRNLERRIMTQQVIDDEGFELAAFLRGPQRCPGTIEDVDRHIRGHDYLVITVVSQVCDLDVRNVAADGVGPETSSIGSKGSYVRAVARCAGDVTGRRGRLWADANGERHVFRVPIGAD